MDRDQKEERIAIKQAQLDELKRKYAEREAMDIDQYSKELFVKTHQYNAYKDIGQRLLGILARREQTTVKDMYKRYGMNEKD